MLKKFTILAVPALLVALLLLEVGLRFVSHPLPPDLIVYTNDRDSIYHHPPMFDVSDAAPKRPDELRIVFVGDSFTWGLTERDVTIPAFAERQLRDAMAQDVTCFNLGTPSFSPTIEYLVVKNFALPLEPDLIVLLVDESDVQDDAIYETMAQTEGDEVVAVNSVDLTYTHPIFRSMLVRRALYTFYIKSGRDYQDFATRVFRPRNSDSREQPSCASHQIFCRDNRYSYSHFDRELDYYSPHYDRTIAHIERIAALAKSFEVPLILGTYPYPAALDTSQFSEEWRSKWSYPAGVRLESRFQPYLESWAERSDLPYIDLAAVVRDHDSPSSLYPGHHSHFNAEGNRLIAKALVERIASEIPTSD